MDFPFFNQIDVIEDPRIRNIIILQTVLEEVSNADVLLYKDFRLFSFKNVISWFYFQNVWVSLCM